MTSSVRPVLPRGDRLLLRGAGYIVPSTDRHDWLRSWEAELYWRRYPPLRPACRELFTDLSFGICRDAIWLRLESFRRLLHGTATPCLIVLSIACCVAVLLATQLYGGWQMVEAQFRDQCSAFLFASPCVVFVTSAIADRRPGLSKSEESQRRRLCRVVFLAAKVVSLLLLTYFVSLDLCSAIAVSLRNVCEYIQVLLFVIASICGLRWAFQDQERRCRTCLRLLNEPQRVGRPSNNWIELSGNESVCREGHGLLRVPELETSWRRASEWIGGVSI